MVRGEREISEAWSRVEQRVSSALRSMSLDDASRASILSSLEDAFRSDARARADIIERTTTGTAQEGLDAGPAVAQAAFEQLGLAFTAPVDPRRAIEIATSHLHGPGAAGGIVLSARLHAHDQATVGAMARELQASFRAGRDVRDIAQRLLEIDDAQVEIPRYVSALEDAVSEGDIAALRATVLAHARSIERLSTPELRAAGSELLRAAARARAEDLARQVRYWIRDRALYQDRVIVRTEGARAFGAAFIESTREHPWTKGYRWNLSPSHPKPDICDLYANQAIDGLGPGGYRAESLPAHPAHPNCFCFLTSILDDDHFERELAALRGEQEPPRGWEDPTVTTATDWLRSQPETTQLTILGPGRRAIWLSLPSRVVGARGRIAPLWQAAGRSGPALRATGPRRSVRGADPFGEAGSRRPAQQAPPAPAPAAAAPTTARRRRNPPTPPPAPAGPPPPPPPPPAPLPPAPPAPPASASTVLAAWRIGNTREVRRQVREMIARTFPGLTPYSAARPLGHVISPMTSTQVRGTHDSVSGEISLNASVRRGLSRLALTIGSTPTPGDANAFRTLVHEEFHGHSSLGYDVIRRRGGYDRMGKVLEEVIVELHARELAARALGVPVTMFEATGGYTHLVPLVRSEVAAVFGNVGVDDRIREAGRRVWAAGSNVIMKPEDYADRFVDALNPPPQRRAALLSGILALRP